MGLEYRIDQRGVVQIQAERQQTYCWSLLVIILILLLGLSVWLYFSGYLTPVDSSTGMQALSLRGKMNEQARLIEEQQQQILKLEAQAVSASRAEQVQISANQELKRKLDLLELELASAKDNVLVYENIISPKDVQLGLSVQHFSLKPRLLDSAGKPLEHDRYYQYQLVIGNIRGNEAGVMGQYEIALKGTQSGAKTTLKFNELQANSTEQNQDVNRFSLKYYQRFEGIIALPVNFIPEQIVVTLRPDSGANPVTKSYDWQSFNLSKKSTAIKE